MKKRLFSMLLALVLVCSLLPTTALAVAHSGTVAFSDLALYDTIAVGTEITGLTNGLDVMYFSSDNNIFVHKSYTGTSCTVEGRVVNDTDTASIGAPQNGYWDLMHIDAANNSITLRSTDPVPTADLDFYTFDPFTLEITISTDPTNSWPTGMQKPGYTWYGWALLDGTAVNQGFALTCQQDTDIFGRWKDDATGDLFPAIYSVSFDYNDNSTAVVTKNTGLRGGVLGWPANPTRSGYTFTGWQDANGVTYTASSTFTADIALTAQWTESTGTPETVTVTFHPEPNSEAIMHHVTIDAGSTLASDDWPDIGVGLGITFDGWFLADGTEIDGSYVFTTDTDIYAHVTYAETVCVLFYVDDELIAEHGIIKGTAVEEFPEVNKNGYNFLGWATTKDDPDTIIDPAQTFDADFELYAIFEEDP
ncbi:MAG: InlB B-repeat-containing protein, partial [Oscillospiraceae bacterium]|nr:InlB B-repeat-containing protein [Oscillospiraceae bacterium]